MNSVEDKKRSLEIKAKLLGYKYTDFSDNSIVMSSKDGNSHIIYYLNEGQLKKKEFNNHHIYLCNKKYALIKSINKTENIILDGNCNVKLWFSAEEVSYLGLNHFLLQNNFNLKGVFRADTGKSIPIEYLDLIVYNVNNKCVLLMIKELGIEIYNDDLNMIRRVPFTTCRFSAALNEMVHIYNDIIVVKDNNKDVVIDHNGNEVTIDINRYINGNYKNTVKRIF